MLVSRPCRHTLLVALATLLCAGSLPLHASDVPAPAAPELRLKDADGEFQSLSQYRGKIVVLNFWATWCAPCKAEMPMLVDAQKRYGPRGVVVIGASLDDAETRDKVPRFLRQQKINFPIWMDATTQELEAFGLGEMLPATVFLDEHGHIAGRVLGMLKKKDLFHRIDWMLGERRGEAPPAVVDNLR